MLNDKKPISSEQTLFADQITQLGRYWYYCPENILMHEVLIDYLTMPFLQVKFMENLYPTDLRDIPSYGRFIKIEGDN